MKTVICDQSNWDRMRVTGEDRSRFLQGMLSNDVAGLAKGAWCRATLLSVKGRVVAIMDVLNEGESYLVISEEGTGEKIKAQLERHAIVDDVTFESTDVSLYRMWNTPEAVWTAPPVLAARAGSSPDEVELRRIEAGFPKYGVDVSEDVFPFEMPLLLESAVSYKKGCYVGQEVVARADARGGANKHFRGLCVDGKDAVSVGAVIASKDRDSVGVVTSSVVSDTLGAIALAYIHKSSWMSGSKVRVGERTATVVDLPFV